MLIYVLDPWSYDRIAVIEEYESCLWTDRFIIAGDFTLVLAEDSPNAHFLRPGMILNNEESDFLMLIESAEKKDGTLTVTGKSIETFLEQRSLPPWTKTGSPREILASLVNDMQTQYSGHLHIWGVTVAAASGTDITEKEKDRTSVYASVVRIAQKHVVGFWLTRYPINVDGAFLEFRTWLPEDRTDGNPDGYATVRFSPEDDNLVGVHEVYTAADDVEAVVAYVPAPFTSTFGSTVDPVIWSADGEISEIDDLDNISAFNTRTQTADTEKLTAKYLTEQLGRYPDDISSPFWTLLPDSEKRFVLREEMKRMAEATYKKTRHDRKLAIDGEVAANSFRYGVDYYLGDLVETTTDLQNGVPKKRKMQVTEYIRSADSSGYREFPTLAEPSTPAPYDDDPAQTTEEADATGLSKVTVDHTFSINGLLPADLEILSPHKITIADDETKKLIGISQTGPRSGDCTLYFMHEGGYIDESDLPITLSDGDELTVDPTDNDSAEYVSGHLTIEIS